jgi:hypothetical protein
MPRIVHFEINCDDPERASKFYRDVFGWKIDKWPGPMDYWLADTGPKEQPGINGGLMRRDKPGAGTWNTVAVESLDDYLKKVTAGGGKQISPTESIPGVGLFAYCTDTEGNVFGLLQSDRNAK